MTVLDEILAGVRAALPTLRARASEVERAAEAMPDPLPFLARRDPTRVGLIAEVKRRSPSAGAINPGLDPVGLAAAYRDGGAMAISVLTEGAHFGGSLQDLARVTQAVEVPTLRKDFLLDPVQLFEARASGASALLLIVRALDQATLRMLIALARDLRMEALVEVHDREELARALEADARCIGVNARNLADFTIDTPRALELVASIPRDHFAVAESGMATRADVERAAEAGADAVLIGGALAAAPSPRALAGELSGVARRER